MSGLFRNLSDKEYGSISSRILYEDNHILIFDKMPGEIVQGDKTGDEPLTEKLKAFIAQRDNKPGNVYIGIPHRIDRPVSGIVIFAKTSKALERISNGFKNGLIHKTYLALTSKAPDPPEGEIRSYIKRNEKINKSFSFQRPEPGTKEAILRYRLVENTRNYFIVEVELLTGRHHQIRCQLASIGCPIKGDLKYGAKRPNPDKSISLHAYRVEFVHPVKKEKMVFTVPHRFFGPTV
ncbi:MAG TPA: RNA pseudouridine synthase [Candidatus Coprenecus stercoripullorum]|nr:RNA pseudouridine synthase [Candidatus Coprenecus stercoripullorum]